MENLQWGIPRVRLDHVVELENREPASRGGHDFLAGGESRSPHLDETRLTVEDSGRHHDEAVGAVRVDDLDRVATAGQGQERGRRDGEHLVGGSIGDV